MMVAKGNCERIGIDGKFTHKTQDGRTVVRARCPCRIIRRRLNRSKTP